MSKTIEALRKSFPKDDALHGQIADTYFYQKAHRKNRPKTKHYAENLTKLLIASITALFIISFFVTVRTLVYNRYLSALSAQTADAKVIKVVHKGVFNKDIVKRADFRGYAKKIFDSSSKNVIVLRNTKKYNWADISIDFRFPINLSHRRLALALRGNVGGEKIGIVLKDSNHRACRLADISLPSRWKDKIIRLGSMSRDIDLSRVSSLRIESGRIGESARWMDSVIDVTIYIKNIALLKEA